MDTALSNEVEAEAADVASAHESRERSRAVPRFTQ